MVVQETRSGVAPVAGFVVAGGHSRRMGCDKALLPWGATTLLEHAVGRLREITPDVRILGGVPGRYPEASAPVVPDDTPGAGPLGGLVTALRLAGGRAVVVLAVDVPLVPSRLLARLVALLADADAAVPVSGSGPEPVVAAYAPACLAPALAHLDAGERRMSAFWPDVRVRQVGPVELRGYGDPDRLFANVNAPKDYERLRPAGE